MTFEIYQSANDGQWYWRLKARNHKIVADGSEGYASEANVRRALRTVKRGLVEFAGCFDDPEADRSGVVYEDEWHSPSAVPLYTWAVTVERAT